ncbi:HNH endonuclease [Kitasatospora sp. NPDC058162]|uniref:HNH endonuclease n=1 Tax=Kitasatospora sp. NPDC058162 TaxID=3346362 RepID=UPI0036D8F810
MGAWLALSVGEDRLHGGNDGYDDSPSEHYSWDSTVPNHGRLAVGDVIALWDAKVLLGISVIERIDIGQAVKPVHSCPVCGKADFYPRKKQELRYSCRKCEAQFDEPKTHHKDVTTYRSRHGSAWVDMAGVLPGSVLRALCDSPKSQHSLRSLQWERLRAAIAETGTVTTVRIADAARHAIAGGHRSATVRARIGQAAFRRRLLADHGEVCSFTGPAPAAVLEAAHLYSYALDGRHHDDGGLLLRRDVHRLFDLGHLAVHPGRLTIDVSEDLRAYPAYGGLHGVAPAIGLADGHLRWLEAHWRTHRGEVTA